MFFSESVIESIAAPGFLITMDGTILRINRHGYSFLERLLGVSQINKIQIIDPEYSGTEVINNQSREICIGKLKLKVTLHNGIDDNGAVKAILYIIDNVLFNADFVRMMNAYDDLITISNEDGVIEFVNTSSFQLTGEHYGVGTDTHDMIRTQIVNEPVTLTVLRQSKPVFKRLKYVSGNVLLNRAYPLFKDNGEIEKVVIMALNANNLAAIDEQLAAQDRNAFGERNIGAVVDSILKDRMIIAASNSMKQIFAMAYRVAPTDASVFIQGESGTGKEIVAEFIHTSSKRSKEPFITVNCSAIPKELFEAEMFGYEEGAFTGANRKGKKGLIETANGGTLFLDEIGELPLSMQSKLLRTVQENKIRHVGGTKDVPIDVRFISATNLSPEKVFNEEIFRSDLYYRLSVISIMIPPLRDRKEDIPPLVTFFLGYYNRKVYDMDVQKYTHLSEKMLHDFTLYRWPGNVRELKNMVERYVILGPQGVDPDLSRHSFAEPSERSLRKKPKSDAELEELLNSGVSVYKAAERLGIAPSTIYRKLKSGKIMLQR